MRVQGEEAPGEIAAALDYANVHQVADLIITGRGGGSMEDLWAFNEEIVARAIYRSRIPVISAVGHEPDVTIADYVADLRAATPSNGAELATPDQEELRATLRGYETRMAQSLGRKLELSRQRLELLQSARILRTPTEYLEDRRQQLDGTLERMTRAMGRRTVEAKAVLLRRQERIPAAWKAASEKRRRDLGTMAARLDAMSPLKVLARGFSITERETGQAVRSAQELRPGDHIRIRLHEGAARATVDGVEV